MVLLWIHIGEWGQFYIQRLDPGCRQRCFLDLKPIWTSCIGTRREHNVMWGLPFVHQTLPWCSAFHARKAWSWILPLLWTGVNKLPYYERICSHLRCESIHTHKSWHGIKQPDRDPLFDVVLCYLQTNLVVRLGSGLNTSNCCPAITTVHMRPFDPNKQM